MVKQRFQQEYIIAVLPWLITIHRLRVERMRDSAERRKTLKRAVWLAHLARVTLPFFGNNGPQVFRDLALLSLCAAKPDSARNYIAKSLQAARKRRARYEQAQSLYALYRIERSLGGAGSEAARSEALKLLGRLNAVDVFFRLEQDIDG